MVINFHILCHLYLVFLKYKNFPTKNPFFFLKNCFPLYYFQRSVYHEMQMSFELYTNNSLIKSLECVLFVVCLCINALVFPFYESNLFFFIYFLESFALRDLYYQFTSFWDCFKPMSRLTDLS